MPKLIGLFAMPPSTRAHAAAPLPMNKPDEVGGTVMKHATAMRPDEVGGHRHEATVGVRGVDEDVD
jgi:hypothetical protein